MTRWSHCCLVFHVAEACTCTQAGHLRSLLWDSQTGCWVRPGGRMVPRSISSLSLWISFEAAAGGGRPLSPQQFSPQLFTPHQDSLNSSTPSSLPTLAPFVGLNLKSYPIVVWEPSLSGMFDTGLLNYVPNFESVCHYSLGWKMLSRPPTKCRPPHLLLSQDPFKTSWVKMKSPLWSRSSPSQPPQ